MCPVRGKINSLMKPHLQPQALPKNFNFKKAVPDWDVNIKDTLITRQFVFKDFRSAFDFMSLSAQYAEEINHHPDWFNSWNKVSVRLSTHSIKALSDLDILMAQAMDHFARKVLGVA